MNETCGKLGLSIGARRRSLLECRVRRERTTGKPDRRTGFQLRSWRSTETCAGHLPSTGEVYLEQDDPKLAKAMGATRSKRQHCARRDWSRRDGEAEDHVRTCQPHW